MAVNFLGGGDEGSATPFLTLLLSACFTGVVITFFNVPIDRVKVLCKLRRTIPCMLMSSIVSTLYFTAKDGLVCSHVALDQRWQSHFPVMQFTFWFMAY